ncbi:MAG TPA: bifunctional DNA primase/polymerase [Acidimicrobiales bacterium]|nr:bifunctional DNA primase/polymerase [Acidimicrobiales bacterium]
MGDAVVVNSRLPPTERPLARAALEAVGRGWSVVPMHTAAAGRCSCGDPSCLSPGKHTHIAWKRRMQEAASAEQVRQWWRRWPRANVGIVSGAVSGLVVLDIDPRHGGGDSLSLLESMHGRMPHTVESLTGGGGQHLYFRHPGTLVPSRPIAPGLDLKGDGGLVVCPPSVHVSGRSYAWEEGCAPGEVALADLPWWLPATAPDPDASKSRGSNAAHHVPPRTEGERSEFAALWARVGVELRPGDNNYLCPFHPDHHPSLHVDAEGCRFYCFGCGRGGGSGRLRRLVHGPRRLVPPPERTEGAYPTSEPTTPVTLPGDTEVRVVGESAYQDVLLELTGGRRHYGGVHMPTVAHLVPEPGNPVDPAAIAVTIAGRTVGYLSHVDALRYQAAIAFAKAAHGEATCVAMLVGGWEREHGDVGLFGLRLRLDPGAMGAPGSPPR